MEYLPLGSLKDYLPKRNLPKSHCLMFAQQICQVSCGGLIFCVSAVVLVNTFDDLRRETLLCLF